MEWVETTAKTLDAAREAALDRLGVGADEAEFDVIEEPKPGLFGRTRGQARIRARVRPTPVRPKQERRRRSKGDKSSGSEKKSPKAAKAADSERDAGRDDDGDVLTDGSAVADPTGVSDEQAADDAPRSGSRSRSRGGRRSGSTTSTTSQEKKMSYDDDRPQSDVTPQEVGDAAVAFMNGLTTAFGTTGTAELTVEGTELEVQVRGDDLGLLVGPGGRTLAAVQDLVRVAAQRRLGDHETRLRIDVAGYRERRTAALARFAADVAAQVRESGTARSLEPMTSADRKVIHDALAEEEGVMSTSSGEDPYRRVVVKPA